MVEIHTRYEPITKRLLVDRVFIGGCVSAVCIGLIAISPVSVCVYIIRPVGIRRVRVRFISLVTIHPIARSILRVSVGIPVLRTLRMVLFGSAKRLYGQ